MSEWAAPGDTAIPAVLLVCYITTIVTVETSIMTTPENQFALIGSRAVLDCSTDLESPMNWFHTPAGSDQPTEFYFLEGILQTHEFYKSGYRVDTSIAGHYTLVIDKVTTLHAGKYDCHDNEAYDKIKASADLNVLGEKCCLSEISCSFINTATNSRRLFPYFGQPLVVVAGKASFVNEM